MPFLLIRLPVTLAMLGCPLYGLWIARATSTFAPVVAGFGVGIALGIAMGVQPLERGHRLGVLLGAVAAVVGLYALGRGVATWSWLLMGFGGWTAVRSAAR